MCRKLRPVHSSFYGGIPERLSTNDGCLIMTPSQYFLNPKTRMHNATFQLLHRISNAPTEVGGSVRQTHVARIIRKLCLVGFFSIHIDLNVNDRKAPTPIETFDQISILDLFPYKVLQIRDNFTFPTVSALQVEMIG